MTRVFTYIPTILFTFSFCLTHITPTSARNVAGLIFNFKSRISSWMQAMQTPAAITGVVFAFLLSPPTSFGQSQPAAEPAVSAALPPVIIELRRQGNEAMYNIDYITARAKFEEIRKRLPQHPAGDLYIATVIWLEDLNKNRRLQTGLYSTESNFY